MDQPIPEFDEKDVVTIATRDYGEERLDKVMAILEEYEKQLGSNPSNFRVYIDILKLANGNLKKVSAFTKLAIQDFREVISYAEYPRFTTEIGMAAVAEEIEKEIIEDDWRQYCEWFEKD